MMPESVQPLVRAARRDLLLAAACLALDLAIAGFFLGRHAGLVIGAGAGLLAALYLADWGRHLGGKRAAAALLALRGWSALLVIAVPLGPWLAMRLRATLRQPALVAWAMSGQLLGGRLKAADALAIEEARTSLRSLRAVGWSLVGLTVLAAIALPGMAPELRDNAVPLLLAILAVGAATVLGGVLASLLLGRITAARLKAARVVALIILPLAPFGTAAAVTVLRRINAGLIARVAAQETSDEPSSPSL